jgi:hypothetical protein
MNTYVYKYVGGPSYTQKEPTVWNSLQSYATGLLAVAMELSEVATDPDNREKNNVIVPIMLERLRASM